MKHSNEEKINNLNITPWNIYIVDKSKYLLGGFGEILYLKKLKKLIIFNVIFFEKNLEYLSPELKEIFLNNIKENKEKEGKNFLEINYNDNFDPHLSDIYSLGKVIIELIIKLENKENNLENSLEILSQEFPLSHLVLKQMLYENPLDRKNSEECLIIIKEAGNRLKPIENNFLIEKNNIINYGVINNGNLDQIKKNICFLNKKAHIYLILNKYILAAEVIEKLLKDYCEIIIDNDFIELNFQLGFCLLKSFKFEKSLEILLIAKNKLIEKIEEKNKEKNAIINNNKQFDIICFYLAENYFYNKSFDNALNELNKISSQKNNFDKNIYNFFLFYELKSKILSDNKNHELAIKTIEFLDTNVNSSFNFNDKVNNVDQIKVQFFSQKALHFLSQEYFYNGNSEKALKLLEKCLKIQFSNDNLNKNNQQFEFYLLNINFLLIFKIINKFN